MYVHVGVGTAMHWIKMKYMLTVSVGLKHKVIGLHTIKNIL